MRKHGTDKFKMEILEELDCTNVELMKEREVYWIKKLDTYKNGYNATPGGDYTGEKNVRYGENHPLHKFTEEEVRKCREWYKQGLKSTDIYN